MLKKQTVRAQKPCPRIDRFLSTELPDLSRSQIEKLIEERRVWLNQKPVTKKSTEIAALDFVEIEIPETFQDSQRAQQPGVIPTEQLVKLFEDDHLLVINKPSGIAVHPGAGPRRETILDRFRHQYPQIEEIKSSDRPGIVHRLDQGTSGVLVLAKDEITQKRMQKKFKKRNIKKTYLALVYGKMRQRNGLIDAPIIRHPRQRKKFTVPLRPSQDRVRDAITEFSVLLEFTDTSYLRLRPATGRTHQLRVHLSHVHHPILGDSLYGKKDRFERLALHASSISFDHPLSGNYLTINAPPPTLFRRYIQAELKKIMNTETRSRTS